MISSLAIFLLLCFGTAGLIAAPGRGQYYPDDKAIALQEMRDSIEDVRHQVNNHEAEIRICDEKLKNLDVIIESVRDQLNDSGKAYKEQLKGSSANLESKIAALETISKGLVADLRQFKTYSNETTAVLEQYQQKITELEKQVGRQNQNIDHLQAAMGSLMEALLGKRQAPAKIAPVAAAPYTLSGDDRSYTVKPGDSLEKIARAHQTTIQGIKTANGLKTDRIIVGKTLVIPAASDK